MVCTDVLGGFCAGRESGVRKAYLYGWTSRVNAKKALTNRAFRATSRQPSTG